MSDKTKQKYEWKGDAAKNANMRKEWRKAISEAKKITPKKK